MGTQAPDLPLFFPGLTPSYQVTHSWHWGAPVNLVYGLSLVWLCAWLRPAVVALLPELARRKLAVAPDSSRSRGKHGLGRLGCAVLLGAATHLFWDEFTHESGLAVSALPVLGQPWLGSFAGYKLLQYSSGVLGVLFLSGWVLRAYRRAPLHADLTLRWREPARRLLLLLILVVAPVSCWIAAYAVALDHVAPSRRLHELAYRGITTTFAATLVLCIAARVLFALRSCRTRTATPVADA